MTDRVRARVFISSVMTGFEAYRAAAAQGVHDAGAKPVMVEDFPSLNVSPRNACLEAIDSCDAVVVVIGVRAGFSTPSGRYVVEEEWLHARKRSKPLFVFVQQGSLEPEAQRIASEISEYVHGQFRRTFSSPEGLRSEVRSSVNGSVIKGGIPVDTSKLQAVLVQKLQGGYEAHVRLAIQPVRAAELVDPLELDSRAFQDALLQLGTEGETPLFSLRAKKTVDAGTSHILFEQSARSSRDPDEWTAAAQLFTNGLLVAERTASNEARSMQVTSLGLALTIGDLTEATASLFQFAAKLYRRLDPYIAHRDFFYGVSLVNLGMRYIHDAAPRQGQGIPVRMSDNGNILAFDWPRPIVREALEDPKEEISRAVSLLRRRSQQGG